MKKKIILTSLILVLIPTLLFSILYGVMYYVIYHTGEDYSDQVIGEWEGVQFLADKQLFPCNDDQKIGLEFTEDTVSITGTILTPGEYTYLWNTGSIAKVNYADGDCIFVVSINSIDLLKVTINSMNYIITLKRNDAEDVEKS